MNPQLIAEALFSTLSPTVSETVTPQGLQRKFIKFLDRHPKFNQFAPAFFYPDHLKTVVGSVKAITDPMPFSDTVFVYVTPNGPLGNGYNIVRIKDRVASLYFESSGVPFAPIVRFNLDDPSQYSTTPAGSFGDPELAIRETLPELSALLERLARNERDEDRGEIWQTRRKVIHRKTGQFVPPFVIITDRPQTVRERSGEPAYTVQPHDRRGHQRRLRNGRVIDVRPCAIHGGSFVARDYLIREIAR